MSSSSVSDSKRNSDSARTESINKSRKGNSGQAIPVPESASSPATAWQKALTAKPGVDMEYFRAYQAKFDASINLRTQFALCEKLFEFRVPNFTAAGASDAVHALLLDVLKKFVESLNLSRVATSPIEGFEKTRAVPCGVALEKAYVQPMFAELLGRIRDAACAGWFAREQSVGNSTNDVEFGTQRSQVDKQKLGYSHASLFMELKPAERRRKNHASMYFAGLKQACAGMAHRLHHYAYFLLMSVETFAIVGGLIGLELLCMKIEDVGTVKMCYGISSSPLCRIFPPCLCMYLCGVNEMANGLLDDVVDLLKNEARQEAENGGFLEL